MTYKELRDTLRQRLAGIALIAEGDDDAAALRRRVDIQRRIESVVDDALESSANSSHEQRHTLLLELERAVNAELGAVRGARHKAFTLVARRRAAVVVEYLRECTRRQPDAKLRRFADQVEDPLFAAAVRDRVREQRDAGIVATIEGGALRWERPLGSEGRYGAGMDERVVELPLAVQFADITRPGKVLDAGGSLNHAYLKQVMGEPQASLTHFTQSSLKEPPLFGGSQVSYVFGDLRATDFKDGAFDRIVCISTLEHIGMDNSRYGGASESAPRSYLQALREIWRLTASGGQVLITFPFGVSRSFDWFQVFDQGQVAEMCAVFVGGDVQERYFRYDGCWSDGKSDSKGPISDTMREQLTTRSIACLRIQKAI